MSENRIGVFLRQTFFFSNQESNEWPILSNFNSIWAITVIYALLYLLCVLFHTTTQKTPVSFAVLITKTFHHSTMVILGCFVLGSVLVDVLKGFKSPLCFEVLFGRSFFSLFLSKVLELINPILASLTHDSTEFGFIPFLERGFLFWEYWCLSKYHPHGGLWVIVVFDSLEQVVKHLFKIPQVFRRNSSSDVERVTRLLIHLGCVGFLVFYLFVFNDFCVTPSFVVLLIFQKICAVYHLTNEKRRNPHLFF